MTIRHFPKATLSLALIGLLLAGGTSAGRCDTRNEAGVGGILIQRIRTSWAGFTPEQRADKVQLRLNAALSQGPIHAHDLTVGQMDGDWCVLFRGRRFLTADPPAAKQNRTVPKALAVTWVKHLQQVLPDLTSNKGK